MMLRELYDLALRERLVKDPDYEPKAISYVVVVGRGGKLRSIVSTLEPPVSGKGKPQAKRMWVPREMVRTFAVQPQFLWDNAEYIFGVSLDPQKKRGKADLWKRTAAFRSLAEEAAVSGDDEALRDLIKLLEQLDEEPLGLEGLLKKTSAESIASNANFAFRHESDAEQLISDRPAVRAWWQARRREKAAAPVQCLVTGEVQPAIETHPKLKRVPGGQTSGVALVSFNNPAFESYGLERNANAPMGRAAGEAIASALNRLLDVGYPSPIDGSPLPVRRFDLTADTAVLYWSRDPGAPVDLFGGGLAADPGKVRALYESPHGGRPPALDDPSPFFALTLSGEMARAKVRGWFETTLGRALRNVRAHFDDIDVPRRSDEPLPLWRLLLATAPLGDRDRLDPSLAAASFAAIIEGRAYPRALLEGAVRRARAEREITPERAALVKAYLARAQRLGRLPKSFPEVTKTMDRDSRSIPYRLGRLFATLEKLQEEALPGTNTTIRDRYFGAASATPVTVFPRLVRGAQPHLAKVRRPVFFERLIQEILGPISRFPSFLPLEDQGLFALGYYHQRQDFFTPKADEPADNGERSAQ